jgi:hypothetical protein
MCADAYKYLLVPDIALIDISRRWPQEIQPTSWEKVYQLVKLMRARIALPASK